MNKSVDGWFGGCRKCVRARVCVQCALCNRINASELGERQRRSRRDYYFCVNASDSIVRISALINRSRNYIVANGVLPFSFQFISVQ